MLEIIFLLVKTLEKNCSGSVCFLASDSSNTVAKEIKGIEDKKKKRLGVLAMMMMMMMRWRRQLKI